MKKAVAGGGGGGVKGTAPGTADLLVCFPARARQHLALVPKPICSPSRSTVDRAAALRRRGHLPQLPGGVVRVHGHGHGHGRGSGSSPMFRASSGGRGRHAAHHHQGDEDDEPRSPKVTCVGQIKAGRPKKPRAAAAGKSWLTVVEEIERMHGRRKKVGSGWLQAVGIRRDALPLLGGALRTLRHKTRCFGSLHGAAVDASTDEDDGGGEGEHGGGDRDRHRHRAAAGGSAAAASVFSKWLMVLEGGQEPLEPGSRDDDEEERHRDGHDERRQQGECADEPPSSAPPPNALLLMRCRSAPAKGLSPLSMSRRGDAGPPAGEVEQEKGGVEDDTTDNGSAEEGRDELVFMSTAPGFLKLSIDIAKETWVVGGGDPLSRSRSWKR